MNRKNKKIKFFCLFLIIIFLTTAGFGCKRISEEVKEKMEPVELEYWRLWDDQDAFEEIIADYQKKHPNITIKYRKFRYQEYQEELLNAWAENRGPDIFSVHQSWIKKYQPKIQPLPEEITLAYQVTKGTLKKEVSYELKTKKSLSLRQFRENFADVVYQNAIINQKIYGLPLSLETLIMFYNRNIFNRSGVAQPPATWEEFLEASQKITRFNQNNEIILSGTALGTGYNITRNFDIISVLMLQNGATMTDSEGYAIFTKSQSRNFNPGIEAIQFYTDFASPVKQAYCWNKEMPNSLDAFITGRVSMVFGYNYHLPTIQSRAPRLDFGIAPIPQVNPDNQVNFANYWLETVSKNSEHPDEAWDFLLFATQKDQVKKYLEKTKRPTALKSLITSQMEDEYLHASVVQILTATNWYQGREPLAAEQTFKEMISQLNNAVDEREKKEILETAVEKINQTIKE